MPPVSVSPGRSASKGGSRPATEKKAVHPLVARAVIVAVIVLVAFGLVRLTGLAGGHTLSPEEHAALVKGHEGAEHDAQQKWLQEHPPQKSVRTCE